MNRGILDGRAGAAIRLDVSLVAAITEEEVKRSRVSSWES